MSVNLLPNKGATIMVNKQIVNKIEKYVVSKTLKNPTWENTVLVRDIKELKELKNSNGPDLQVYGSSHLVQTLI